VLLLYSSPRRARAMCCFMKGLRQLIKSRPSGRLAAICLAYALAVQATMASVGLGMSVGAAPHQAGLVFCGLTSDQTVTAPTDPGDPRRPGSGRNVRSASSPRAGHVATTGEGPAIPAYAGLLIAVLRASRRHNQTMSHTSATVEPSALSPPVTL
jgi:hypothetical protein